jgi:hypothetical protein
VSQKRVNLIDVHPCARLGNCPSHLNIKDESR